MLIHNSIIELNFRQLSEYEPLDYLCYALPDKERRNGGVLRKKWITQLAHTSAGGTWCSGVDLLTFEDSLWGQFKPLKPRKDHITKKPIKYESPRKTVTELYALKPSYEIAQKIAETNNLELGLIVSECPKTGEALNFWRWVVSEPRVEIHITEGAKKAGALLTAGYCALGLPGIYSGYRNPKDDYNTPIGESFLIPQLATIAQPQRKIMFAFDSDEKVETRAAVRLATIKTAKLLQAKGCSCQVVTWGHDNGMSKGVDDLIDHRGLDYFVDRLKKAVDLDTYNLQTLLNLSDQTDEARNEKYLSEADIKPGAQIIGLKSAKGTGKTKLIEQLALQATRKGQRILVLSHRIQLAKSLCDRLGIDHVDDFRLSETRGALGYGLCVDSLRRASKARFNPSEWENSVIILDEIEQVLWHMLSSSTCRKNRVEILQNFQEVLRVAVGSGGKIICADADLSKIAIDFLKMLLGFEVVQHLVENHFLPVAGNRNCYVYKSPAEVINRATEALTAGEKVFISLGAQKEQSTWSTVNVETLISESVATKKIIRIDAQTIRDPNHPAYDCITRINELVAEYDCVIASPTLETGVSIDLLGHFSGVYGIFHGVQTVDAASQSLERVRDHCDRHIFAATRGLNFIGHGETNLKLLLRSTHEQAKSTMNSLRQADLGGVDYDLMNPDILQTSLLTWARKAVVVNSQMHRYHLSLTEKLEQEGYTMLEGSTLDRVRTKEIKEEIKQIKEVAYEEKREAIVQAEDLTAQEYKQLDKKVNLTQQERWQLEKAKIKKLYKQEVTIDLVEKHDQGLYGKLKLHYYLTVGREFMHTKEEQSFATLASQIFGLPSSRSSYFKPDVVQKLVLLKVLGMEALGVKEFLNSQIEFTHDSLQAWADKIKPYYREIRKIYGIKISDKIRPIVIANGFLKFLGLKLIYQGRPWSDTRRQRVYSICDLNHDNRNDIFKEWLKSDRLAHQVKNPSPLISI